MFKNILVPVDGSTLAAGALSHALAVANYDTVITLLRVVESCPSPNSVANPLDWELQRREASAYLDELMAQRVNGVDCQVEKAIQGGLAAERIVEQARERGHDLVVISSHGRSGLSEWNTGAVAHKVIERSGVSILLVRAQKAAEITPSGMLDAARYRRILVPIDGSLRSKAVLHLATRLAKVHDAELLLAHGIMTPELFEKTALCPEDTLLVDSVVAHNRRQAEAYFSDLSQRLDIAIKTYVFTGAEGAESLHRFAQEKEVDLVVLSAHGRTTACAWPYGSVTASFIAYGTTHLLIVQDLPWQDTEESSAEQLRKENRLASLSVLGFHALASEKGLSGLNGSTFRLPNISSFRK